MRLLGIIWFPLDCLMALFLRRDGIQLGIIKLDKLGDFVLILPYIHAQPYPPILIVTDYVEPFARLLCPRSMVVSIRLSPFYWNPVYRVRCLYRMRQLGIRTMVHPTPAWFRFLWDVSPLVRASGASHRIAFQSTEPIPWWARVWTHFFGQSPSEWVPAMGHDQQALFSLMPNKIVPNRRVVNELGPIVVAPLASAMGKSWPLEWMKIVIQELEKKGYLVLVVGLESDRSVLEELGVKNEQLCLSVSGNAVTIVELLTKSRCMIACDNGLAHLAIYLGLPTVVVAGAGQWGRFFPYPDETNRSLSTLVSEVGCKGCNWACEYRVKGPTPCMAQVTPNQVLDQIYYFLGASHD